MNNKNLGFWKDEEVKELFSFIEKQREKNIPLIKAFENFAEKTGRMKNSVRNYYYFHLKFMEKNNSEAKRLGINLSRHSKTIFEKFSKEDEENLKNEVLKLIKQGYSVRKACIMLSDNDMNKMVRLQNKIRLMQKNQNIFNKQSSRKNSKKEFFIASENFNILQMPKKNIHISESEIGSLFLGLAKMVQRNAMQMAESTVISEKEKLLNEIKELNIALEQKNQELSKLKSVNDGLSSTLHELEKKFSGSGSDKIITAKKVSNARQEKFYDIIKKVQSKAATK